MMSTKFFFCIIACEELTHLTGRHCRPLHPKRRAFKFFGDLQSVSAVRRVGARGVAMPCCSRHHLVRRRPAMCGQTSATTTLRPTASSCGSLHSVQGRPSTSGHATCDKRLVCMISSRSWCSNFHRCLFCRGAVEAGEKGGQRRQHRRHQRQLVIRH